MIRYFLLAWARRARLPERVLVVLLLLYKSLWKAVYMPKETCKTNHDEVKSRYCAECGEEVNSPDDERVTSMIRRTVESVLDERGVGSKKKADDKDKKDDRDDDDKKKKPSIADAFRGRK